MEKIIYVGVIIVPETMGQMASREQTGCACNTSMTAFFQARDGKAREASVVIMAPPVATHCAAHVIWGLAILGQADTDWPINASVSNGNNEVKSLHPGNHLRGGVRRAAGTTLFLFQRFQAGNVIF